MESLYQVSLQVSQSGEFGCGQQKVAWNPRLHSAPGLGLSKTPTAEMEHSLHEANTVSASQVPVSSHSFDSSMRKKLLETRHRCSSSSSLSVIHDPPVFLLVTSRSVQQFLAKCDRGETSKGVTYTGRTLNYRARLLTTPGCKPQLTHTATLPERHQGLQVPHAQSWGDLFHSPFHPPVVRPVSPPSSSPVPGFRVPVPRRVDMPPDDDWRQSSYALPSRHRRTGREEFLFVLADAPGREQITARAMQHSRW
ncbi:hypothetical protein FD755_015866 [Muntiacus reevesi]|uniref:Uncharacterized protein n=1 Tax=Muntiacus reevesi TaxID=9886 RepID=A0A5N3XFN8_MUNRE|nr:hypothetical protein FD755_015866 [Muntiacus reevesi]